VPRRSHTFLVSAGATGARGVTSVVPNVLAIAKPFLVVLLPVPAETGSRRCYEWTSSQGVAIGLTPSQAGPVAAPAS
jgi:hypothetical protein